MNNASPFVLPASLCHAHICLCTLQEFHQLNNAAVLGIREGTWLRVITDVSHKVVDVVLHGPHGGVAFLKDQEPLAVQCSDNDGVSVKFMMQ